MNIQVTHFACGRCAVNGQWMYDTPSGLMRLYIIHSGEGEVYNCSAHHHLCAGKVYLFTQSDDFRVIDSHSMDHSFFDFFTDFMLKYGSFQELDQSDFSFINWDGIASMLNNRQDHTNTLKSFLEMLLNHIDEQYALPIVTNSTILQALSLIQAQSKDITTASLARQLNVNECHLIRIFKKVTGVPPMKYIRSCRIASGIMCIQNGMNISQASEACGYTSPIAFSQAVKKETGILPSKLR